MVKKKKNLQQDEIGRLVYETGFAWIQDKNNIDRREKDSGRRLHLNNRRTKHLSHIYSKFLQWCAVIKTKPIGDFQGLMIFLIYFFYNGHWYIFIRSDSFILTLYLIFLHPQMQMIN